MKTQAALAAKAIKKELKIKYPSIKFSVKSRNYSGGDAVDISYENACPTKHIASIVKKYQYGHFDGMNDIYEYSNSRDDLPQAKYVQVNRIITAELQEQTKKNIAESYGITDHTDEKQWLAKCNTWSDIVVGRALSEKTF